MKTSQLFAPLVVAFWLSPLACGDSNPADPIPQRFQAFAKAVEQERAALGAPGVAVAVVEKGAVTFAHGFGQKDPSKPDPVLPTTLFRIGSCTKMLTAIALLQNVQAGQVTLDDPITNDVPAFHLNQTPTAVAGIKVRHLLSHAGGLSDYAETNAPANEQTDAALEQFLTGRFADIGYVASPPGALWAYANPDYMVAGLIAEKASGVPYRSLMHDRVFVPLGMNRTFFLPSEVLADGDYAVGTNCKTSGGAYCLSPEVGSVIQPDSYDNPWARPAGFAWSSVLDLAEVARFLVHGQDDVLASDLWAAMTSAQISTKQAGDIESYGFGVMVYDGFGGGAAFPYRALKMVTHGGDIAGFAADIYCLPTLDLCLVALANSSGAHLANSIIVGLETLTTLPAPSTMPDILAKPERYPLYAGAYNDPLGVGQVNVTTDGTNLFIQIPSLDASNTPYTQQLQPTTVDNFIVTVQGTPMPLTFITDSNGVYTYIRCRPYLAIRTG